MNNRYVALLGQQDRPTDAVEDYCRHLGAAMRNQDSPLKILRVRWADIGWRAALRELLCAAPPKNTWFLLQYTALAWSRHGFSLPILKLIRFLKKNGGQCAVVYHDIDPYPGTRLIDRIRRAVQLYTMRKALRLADLTVLTVATEKMFWMPAESPNTVFIPIGANLPYPELAWLQKKHSATDAPTVAVFSLSQGTAGEAEVQIIADAARHASAQLGKLRIAVLGRNSEVSGISLKEKLASLPVEVTTYGLIGAEEVVRVLGSCNVMLFVRGPISTRRGSALAGIACGLPVIAAEGWETAAPITEAGVMLLPAGDRAAFGPALVRVLSDSSLRESLAQRSREAQTTHFSWAQIAAKYLATLGEKQP